MLESLGFQSISRGLLININCAGIKNFGLFSEKFDKKLEHGSKASSNV